MNGVVKFVTVAAAVLACLSGVQAEVVIETVTVGNPGNAGENSGESEPDGYGPDRICGAVGYVYNIGKYEVTAGQYTEFLNAVAGDDTYELYNVNMWSNQYGCKIERTGSSGSYTYSVAADRADRPVNYVNWGDAARFANWLHNGQPGLGTPVPQDQNSTEDGSYYLNGAVTDPALLAVVRESDATWVIPSEDEWYKAAYHYNDGVTGNYYDYPTSSDSVPGYVNDSGNLSGTGTPFTEGGTDPGNYATYDGDGGTNGIGSPYYRTEMGEWENSDSPYGTFDQGGNVWEWNEAELFVGLSRGVRGGSFFNDTPIEYILRAAYRNASWYPTLDTKEAGFRVALMGDCNGNGIPDECDLTCVGPCTGGGCGQSNDANSDGIPDECGACCHSGGCDQVIQATCDTFGKYGGYGTTCEAECPAGIPAVSTWGLAVTALLVLTAGTLVLAYRRRPSYVA